MNHRLATLSLFAVAALAPAVLFAGAPSDIVHFSGFAHSPLGQAGLSRGADGTLSVDNLGSSGKDGVAANFGGSTGGMYFIDALDPDSDNDNIVVDFGAVQWRLEVRVDRIEMAGVAPSGYQIGVLDGEGGVNIASDGSRGGADFFGTIVFPGGGTLESLLSYAQPSESGLFLGGPFVFTTQTGEVIDHATGFRAIPPAINGLEVTAPSIRYTNSDGTPSAKFNVKQSFGQTHPMDRNYARNVPEGVYYAGLGEATLDVSDRSLTVDNLGSSGKDGVAAGVSLSIGAPRDAASGLPTGKRQHKPVNITKEVDKSTPYLYKSSIHDNPLYEDRGQAGDNPLFEMSFSGNGAGGVGMNAEAVGLGTDTFRLTVVQGGETLIDETVTGRGTSRLIGDMLFLEGGPLGGQEEDDILWGADKGYYGGYSSSGFATALTVNGSSAVLNPSVPVEVQFEALIDSRGALGGFGAIDFTYDMMSAPVSITNIAQVPEPTAIVLALLALLIVGAWKKR